MLVLSRMRNQKVLLEDPAWGYRIELVVVEIRGDKVRLGFEAPKNAAIWRNELGEFRGDHSRLSNDGLPTLRELKGSCPDATGDKSAVEFVRAIRDGPFCIEDVAG